MIGLTMCVLMQNGMTALYIASNRGHGAVVQLLLQKDADVSISKTVCFISTKFLHFLPTYIPL